MEEKVEQAQIDTTLKPVEEEKIEISMVDDYNFNIIYPRNQQVLNLDMLLKDKVKLEEDKQEILKTLERNNQATIFLDKAIADAKEAGARTSNEIKEAEVIAQAKKTPVVETPIAEEVIEE